ncbi:MAG: PadR family transcriptional regulator [Candidatus Nanoarchaeia archaeon]
MAVRGYLKLLVYKGLQGKPMSGYAIMNMIEEKTGHRPSSGSIYPLLERMANDGLVDFEEKLNKKIYSLTSQGKKEVDHAVNEVEKILLDLKEKVKILGVLQGTDMSHYLESIEQRLKGKIPFGTLGDDIENLQVSLFKLNATGVMQKKTPQVRKILKRANNDLKKL